MIGCEALGSMDVEVGYKLLLFVLSALCFLE